MLAGEASSSRDHRRHLPQPTGHCNIPVTQILTREPVVKGRCCWHVGRAKSAMYATATPGSRALDCVREARSSNTRCHGGESASVHWAVSNHGLELCIVILVDVDIPIGKEIALQKQHRAK